MNCRANKFNEKVKNVKNVDKNDVINQLFSTNETDIQELIGKIENSLIVNFHFNTDTQVNLPPE